MNNMNILQMIRQGSPRQAVEQLLSRNTNPMIRELVNKAKNGDSKGVEEFARNLYKQQGKNYDEEFNKFINDLGLKK